MEDIIGWILVVAFFSVLAVMIYRGVKLYKEHQRKTEEAQQRREEALATLKREREASWSRMGTGITKVDNTPYAYSANKNATTVTNTASNQQTTYAHKDDGPDLLTTMIVADMLFNHKESSAGTVKWDNDVPRVTTSSSSSSDDDDSRRSSSYSSGPSYSSSSDSGPSYSSSSDSGPSSDW